MGHSFVQKQIVHQISCDDILQQNEGAKSKNKYVLEVVRALIYTNKVPKFIWGETILMAT